MTRPMHSRQLDGLSALLTQLADVLAEDGSGRKSLGVMRAHASAIGFPVGGSGEGGTNGSTPTSSTERSAVLENDPTVEDYEHQVADLAKLAVLARRIVDRHKRYTYDRNVTVCSSCSEELPRGRVRCPKCNLHPDTRVCTNVTCLEVLGAKDPGTHGWCDTCRKFMSRKGRLPTAEDVAKRHERQRQAVS